MFERFQGSSQNTIRHGKCRFCYKAPKVRNLFQNISRRMLLIYSFKDSSCLWIHVCFHCLRCGLCKVIAMLYIQHCHPTSSVHYISIHFIIIDNPSSYWVHWVFVSFLIFWSHTFSICLSEFDLFVDIYFHRDLILALVIQKRNGTWLQFWFISTRMSRRQSSNMSSVLSTYKQIIVYRYACAS